jgi:four helix bundle protein
MPDASERTQMDRKLASYRDLEIWKIARDLAILVHKMTLEKLPKFEMYEEGSQIRRCSKSISSNLVEGFGRRRYKNDYIKFLTYALASYDETIDHLEILKETSSLSDKAVFDDLLSQYNVLGKKINKFLQAVASDHLAPKDLVGQKIFENEY